MSKLTYFIPSFSKLSIKAAVVHENICPGLKDVFALHLASSAFERPRVFILFSCVAMATGRSTSGGLGLQTKQASGLDSQLPGWAPPGPADERNYF